MVVIAELRSFQFGFDWSKNVDQNLKHEIEFIINSNESLAENKIKSKIEQVLSEYKYRNDIHEHGKDPNR